jgi:hypothetical protein
MDAEGCSAKPKLIASLLVSEALTDLIIETQGSFVRIPDC